MKQNSPSHSPLGKESEYRCHYAPELLFPIPRSQGRDELGIGSNLPFQGIDLWTAFELSWLNQRGIPQVAMAEFQVPCESPNIIESKSLKLYLNSFNQTKYNNKQDVMNVIETDLSISAGSNVSVYLVPVTAQISPVADLRDFSCIDAIETEIDQYQPDGNLLHVDSNEQVTERLVSHLLKSNCPVTGQPDWASLFVEYSGSRIDRASLLRYLVSYRQHMGFHEQCVEQIFIDLLEHCSIEKLTVSARYLRRGGLDINPVRSTEKTYGIIGRQSRQ